MINIKKEHLYIALLFPGFIGLLWFEKPLKSLLNHYCTNELQNINLFSQPGNIIGVTKQVFFALSIGVFFGGLLLRTGSLIVVSVFHGLVNFAFSGGELSQAVQKEVIGKSEEGINWNSLIPTTILFTFILFGGLYMIRKVNKEDVLEKLGF